MLFSPLALSPPELWLQSAFGGFSSFCGETNREPGPPPTSPRSGTPTAGPAAPRKSGRKAAAPSAGLGRGRGGGRARSGAHRFAPVRSEPAARWLLEPGRTALVTFRTGSRGPLAALIPRHEFICVARRTPPRPCDTRGRRRGPCQAASTRGLRAGLWHPAANGCPRGLGLAAALPTSLLTTTGSGAAEVASAPVRYGHDRKPRGWRLIPAASCRARAGGTWRVPPANVAVAHRPTVGQFPCSCIAQSGGTSIPRAAAPWAVGGQGGVAPATPAPHPRTLR